MTGNASQACTAFPHTAHKVAVDNTQSNRGLQAELLYLRLTHVAFQEVVVHDNGGVLDVEVTGNPPQLSNIQVPALLIKARHLALLQLTCSITHQCLPAYTLTAQEGCLIGTGLECLSEIAVLTEQSTELLLATWGRVMMSTH